MMKKVLFGAISAALFLGATQAQAGERTLIDNSRLWTAGGKEQSSKVVADRTLAGGKAVQITSTGLNSKYSANLSQRLIHAYKQGERIILSGMVKAEKPTFVDLNIELADAPFSKIGGGSLEVGTEWQPYKVEIISGADQAAGNTRAIVQINSSARTLYFGPLTVVAKSIE
jgi:hypothetical protein